MPATDRVRGGRHGFVVTRTPAERNPGGGRLAAAAMRGHHEHACAGSTSPRATSAWNSSDMTRDDFLSMFGLRAPIVNAPMGGVAGGRLAAAVSQAGGLGMIGMGSGGTRERLQAELTYVPSGTRVGIGLVDWVAAHRPELLDLALAASPALLAVSFGEEFTWVERAHRHGVPTAVQVADLASASSALEAGADVLVARGLEGGGHGRPLHDRDELLRAIVELTARPVLAAGAIATAADVEHVLELGASGAWVGTAFAATTESLSTPGERRALFAAAGDDTTLTSSFDRAAGHAWPPDIPERVIANAFTNRWHQDGPGLDVEAAAEELARGVADDDPQWRPVNAGLGVGRLRREQSAAQVLRDLVPG